MQISLKYRPVTFSTVIGQSVAKRILVNSVKMNRIPKAILLHGIRGIGKTTLAKIYAKAINCSNFTDDLCGKCPACVESNNPEVIEWDAASHNGVDDIRELGKILELITKQKFRVVILDECHLLTKQAQAALLLILEDVKNTVFIFVTTDPMKMEDTIRSRSMEIALKPISPSETAQCIGQVLQAEGVAYREDFVEGLSRYGGGSLRDVEQILEQMLVLANGEELTVEMLEDTVGVIGVERYKELAGVLVSKDLQYGFTELKRWYEGGVDLSLLFDKGIPILLRDFMVYLSGSYGEGVQYYSGIGHKVFEDHLTLTIGEVKLMLVEWENWSGMIPKSDFPRLIWECYLGKILI